MVKYQDYSHSGPFSHCRGKLGQCGKTVVAALSELCADCRKDAEKGGKAVEAEVKKLEQELQQKPAEPAVPVVPQAAPAPNEDDKPAAVQHPEAVTESTVKPVEISVPDKPKPAATPESASQPGPKVPDAVSQSTSQPGPKDATVPSPASGPPKKDGVPVESAQPEAKPVAADKAAEVKHVGDNETGGADEGTK